VVAQNYKQRVKVLSSEIKDRSITIVGPIYPKNKEVLYKIFQKRKIEIQNITFKYQRESEKTYKQFYSALQSGFIENKTVVLTTRPKHALPEESLYFNLKKIKRVYVLDPQEYIIGGSGGYTYRPNLFVTVQKLRYAKLRYDWQNNKMQELINKIRVSRRPYTPTIWDAHIVDALELLAKAYKESPGNLRSSLGSIKGFQGISGLIDFTKQTQYGLGQEGFALLAVKSNGCPDDQVKCEDSKEDPKPCRDNYEDCPD
jgi:hypothetical protein